MDEKSGLSGLGRKLVQVGGYHIAGIFQQGKNSYNLSGALNVENLTA